MANGQLLASDNFASGSLAAGWSNAFGIAKCQVTGSPFITEPTALSTNCGQIWTGLVWPNDQTSEVTVKTLTTEANTFIALYVRMQTGAMSGYRADFTNGTLQAIYRFDAGTPTALATRDSINVLGAVAAGDRLTFQAAGASLAVYKNNIPIAYAFDTTYTSGSPGFLQFTSVNITHTQVSSWAGYNCVQQDGIWQKQGILFPAKSSYVSGGANFTNGTQNPSLLFEGNAQILSGTVLKMWYQAGLDLNYAESTDGVNWTQYSGNPVVTHSVNGFPNALWDPCVFKVGSTYHLYAGSSAVYHSTSANGLSWAAATNVFNAGTVGAWDAHAVFFFSPFYIDGGGTWWATYGGEAVSPSTFPAGLGIATSPDGLTWTRYAGNPVLTSVSCMVRPVLINGVWYGWGQTGNPGQSVHAIDPGEGLRLQSTDLINWTNPVHSAHHSQMFDGANGVNGGFFTTTSPIDVNGKAYLYGTSIYDDVNGGMQQIAYAVGPTTVANIVTQNEDALQSVSTDSFQRANVNPLAAPWTNILSTLQLVSNKVEATSTATKTKAAYNGTFSNDQYSSVVVGALAANAIVSPTVRSSLVANTGYFASLAVAGGAGTAGTVTIKQVVAGVETSLGPSVAITPQVGDTLTLSVVGNIVNFFQNGFLVVQIEDPNPITTGYPGMMVLVPSSLTDATITSWAGGNANAIPSYITVGNFITKSVPVTITNADGFALAITTPTTDLLQGAPTAVCFTDTNGNELTVTGATTGSEIAAPVPVVLCDPNGLPLTYPRTITSNGHSIVVTSTLTGKKLAQPHPVVLTDENGFGFVISGSGTFVRNPTPIAPCDINGKALTITLS
jgi:hypothetical protein